MHSVIFLSIIGFERYNIVFATNELLQIGMQMFAKHDLHVL